MWNFLMVGYAGALILIWIVAGGYVTQANVKLSSYKNKDDNLHRAYWTTFWAAFITWTLIGLTIIAAILVVIGGAVLFSTGVGEVAVEASESAADVKMVADKATHKKKNHKWLRYVIIGFLVIAFILTVLTGTLAAIAASSMSKSPNYDPTVSKLTKARSDCVIAAIICLVSTGMVIIGIIIYIVVLIQNKKRQKMLKEKEEKQKEIEKEMKKEEHDKIVDSLAKIKEKELEKKLGNPN